MSDKGIINHRKGSVTFTVEIDGQKKTIVLKPGANRLSAEQYAALKQHRLFNAMFRPTTDSEVVHVPDPARPGETKVEQISKKRTPKFQEAPIDHIDENEIKSATSTDAAPTVTTSGRADETPKNGGKK